MTVTIITTTIIIVMLLALIGLSWSRLGNIEKNTKIICIFVGIIIVFALTFIIYNISKIGITYEDKNVMMTIRRVFVSLFAIINGYLILPYSFRKLEQINNEQIKKEKIKRSIIIVLILVVAIFIFESMYLGNMQQGILDMMKGK